MNHFDGFGQWFEMLVGVLGAVDGVGLIYTHLTEQLVDRSKVLAIGQI